MARPSSACARGRVAPRRSPMTANNATIRWCAIYTRKSSEEGLGPRSVYGARRCSLRTDCGRLPLPRYSFPSERAITC
jgi:hypothetical protein